MTRYERSVRIIGSDGQQKLLSSSVLLVGVGGVGGAVFEMLLRAGVGRITVVDGDQFEESNLNRQLLATVSTLGRFKAESAVERGAEVNPGVAVTPICKRFDETSADEILSGRFDYCVDAIDSVADKVLLIERAKSRGIPVISAMGAGNRLTADFKVTDIFKTSDDGLAKAVRKRLKALGVTGVKAVCADSPCCPSEGLGSISFAPNAMGCVIAGEVIRELLCR